RSAPPGKRFFRRTINVDGVVETARLVMTADNTFEAWINGQNAGKGQNFHQGHARNVSSLLKPGANHIAVTAVNTLDTANPAGLVGALDIKYRDGRMQTIRTDATWEAAKSAEGNWSAAMELGPMGMGPWGDVQESPEAVDAIPDIAIPSRVLAEMGVPPDFKASANIRYIHKRIGETDVYFAANPEPSEVEARCTFRVSGKQPELWWPDTGRTELATACEIKNGCTTLPLRFDPSGSMFVVFRSRRLVPRDAGTTNILSRSERTTLSGPWEVSFDPKWGGPDKPVTFEKLEDWSKHSDPGIRYYSGTATYRRTFNWQPIAGSGDIPVAVDSGKRATGMSPLPARISLDLGKVAIMAEVRLNGRDLGILWKPPFRVDVTDALKPGENTLELRVVNLWINRQIGDEQLPEDSDRNPSGNLKVWPAWLAEGKPSPTGRYTFSSWRLWKKDDPLVESGLLGPVTLELTALK
ncbi:MAG: hypothetical protein HZA91_11675, partial [Verrucomicrobia bacterium]|nr:hypothetical protein [Verrucomicrobiota bacterium]